MIGNSDVISQPDFNRAAAHWEANQHSRQENRRSTEGHRAPDHPWPHSRNRAASISHTSRWSSWSGSEADSFREAAEPLTYQRFTAAQLDAADFELEYLIDDTLTAGQPLIIAGGKKCLKTNILIDAGISLATGKSFLGSLAVKRPARVAIMSGESGMYTIQETARRISLSKGIELRDVQDLIFSPDLPRFADIRHLDALEKFVVDDEIEVLIIDPAYLCMDLEGREGSLFATGQQLRGLSQRCEKNGVTLCLCHHAKKGITDPFAPPELEHIAWAGFQEYARQWWLVGRRKRYEPGTGKHELWFSVGGSAGHSSLWAADVIEGTRSTQGGRKWEVTLDTAANAREEAEARIEQEKQSTRQKKHSDKVEAAKAAIADALRSLDGHTDTKDNIKTRAACKGAAFDDAFAYLLRVGKLTPTRITRSNKQTYDAFRYEFENR